MSDKSIKSMSDLTSMHRDVPTRPQPSMPPKRDSFPFRWIKRLIWLYFWLLLFEGALRKWILPDYSDYLLIVRDPVAIGIIWFAIRDRLFQASSIAIAFAVLVPAFCLLGTIQVMNGLSPAVAAFGLRTYFLHLPVIFVIAATFRFRDFQELGRAISIVSIAMTPLVVLQYLSPQDAWVNFAAGGEAGQMSASGEHIRTPGLFPFISGMVAFNACAFAVALGAEFTPGFLSRRLRWLAVMACVICGALSGSRSVVVAMFLVLVGVLVGTCLSLKSFKGALRVGGLSIVAMGLLSTSVVLQTGIDGLVERFADAGLGQGLLLRAVQPFLDFGEYLKDGTVLGSGLGLGTNAGSRLATGDVQFILGEGEWERVILEAGIVLGLLYLLCRAWLTVSLGLDALRAAGRGYLLPLLLWFACAPDLLLGQWGPPNQLGFAVFVTGLTLAALRVERDAMRSGATLGTRPLGSLYHKTVPSRA